MNQAFICEAIRTPIGRFGGVLSSIRTDDLASIPIKYLIDKNHKADWGKLDEVFFGNANQAWEEIEISQECPYYWVHIPKKYRHIPLIVYVPQGCMLFKQQHNV